MMGTAFVSATHPGRAGPTVLSEVRRLFQAFHAESIRYCHWKSNQHLRASMLGETDLDLLVDRRASQSLARALSETSFKRVDTPTLRGYPAVESYIGMDSETGRLIHLHLHHQLTLGEKHLKGYRLDWEELVLSTRILDPEEGVYITDPNVEVVILIVRTTLKLRLRDLLLAGMGRRCIGPDVLRELDWLAARGEPECLLGLARDLVGDQAGRLVAEIVATRTLSVSQLVLFRRSAKPSLREYRTFRALDARLRRWSREWRKVFNQAVLRHLGVVVPTRRRPVTGGLIVAFVGADGSGKSTLAREISRWLSGVLDVLPVYFGSGQGPASLPRRVLEGAASLARRPTATAAPPTDVSRRGRGTSRFRTAGELLWVWALSRERRQRAAQARRGRNRGMVVLCDRFPQAFAVGNDGPCLGHWRDHPSWAQRTVAREELAAIEYVERLRPDLVIKLNVTPEIAIQRKPDTPPVLLQAKLRILEQLQFPRQTRTVAIDATRPLDEVLLEAKRAVWENF